MKKAKIKTGSVLDKFIYTKDKFDISFLTGVHSIFDETDILLDNLIYWTKPNGKLLITGLFNCFPYDVYIKYCKSKDHGNGIVEPGWNMFSIETISKILNKKASKKF